MTKTIDLAKKRTVRLPSSWKGKAFVMTTPDTIILKKTAQSVTFNEFRARIKKANIKFSPLEIDREIQTYRKGR